MASYNYETNATLKNKVLSASGLISKVSNDHVLFTNILLSGKTQLNFYSISHDTILKKLTLPANVRAIKPLGVTNGFEVSRILYYTGNDDTTVFVSDWSGNVEKVKFPNYSKRNLGTSGHNRFIVSTFNYVFET